MEFDRDNPYSCCQECKFYTDKFDKNTPKICTTATEGGNVCYAEKFWNEGYRYALDQLVEVLKKYREEVE